MRIRNQQQLAQLRAYIEGHGLTFNPSDTFEWRQIHHAVAVNQTRGTVTEVFGSSKSADANATTIACNLPEANQLEDNETGIVAEIWAEPLEATSANKLTDVVRFFSYGEIVEFNVGSERVMRDRLLSRVAKRSGFQALVTTEGAVTAPAYYQAHALDDGLQLALPDRIVIPKGEKFGMKVRHYGTANLSANLDVRFSLWTLVVRHSTI